MLLLFSYFRYSRFYSLKNTTPTIIFYNYRCGNLSRICLMRNRVLRYMSINLCCTQNNGHIVCTAFAYTVFILQSTSDHFNIACYRRARGDIWKDSLQDMQISSGHITGMFLSRSRSYAGERQTLPPECPTLSSPPVIHSPFTCPENTR